MKMNFTVTIECDDEHAFDDMLGELESSVVNISNSYPGTVSMSEGTIIDDGFANADSDPAADRGDFEFHRDHDQ